MKLLRDCGIFCNDGKDQLKVSEDNFPLEIFYVRNSDIPQYLEDGVVDVAIVGENLLIETSKNIDVVEHLGFSKCRLSMALSKDIDTDDLSYFNSKKIATSYPNTLRRFLEENNIKADIHVISGSVEIAPNIGLADGICDIVSSGSTLFKNGLRETKMILKSEAVLAKNQNLSEDKEVILEKLLFRIQAVKKAKNSKYILLNVPNAKIDSVSEILPVLKSPTVIPLAEEGWSSIHSVIDDNISAIFKSDVAGWSSIHSVIDDNSFWEVIDELKQAGAQDILIIPIDEMVI
ncbi:ATP phosphoribosyltransferase [Soonwooa sp.]|uniref:ATP phosphoribosyltransferase n=1 Tax=Soonwooa sp. TaxID=1938592 RepID=UPI0028ABDDA0|nr:ATP phosphoribosyltransferase [Soonwooa sp.]